MREWVDGWLGDCVLETKWALFTILLHTDTYSHTHRHTRIHTYSLGESRSLCGIEIKQRVYSSRLFAGHRFEYVSVAASIAAAIRLVRCVVAQCL